MSKGRGGRGRNRKPHEKRNDQKLAAEMRSQGKTLREIGGEIGISHNQVRADLKDIEQSLFEAAQEKMETMRANQLAKLRYAQMESMKAWRRSLEDAETITIKSGGKHGGEEIEKVSGRSGDPKHMSNFIKSVRDESELLGLLQHDSSGGKSMDKAEAAIAQQIMDARAMAGHYIPPDLTFREGNEDDGTESPPAE